MHYWLVKYILDNTVNMGPVFGTVVIGENRYAAYQNACISLGIDSIPNNKKTIVTIDDLGISNYDLPAVYRVEYYYAATYMIGGIYSIFVQNSDDRSSVITPVQLFNDIQNTVMSWTPLSDAGVQGVSGIYFQEFIKQGA